MAAALVTLLGVAGLVVPSSAAGASQHSDPHLPIVFVHGGSGSAQQYQTAALRWASNDYGNVVTGIDRTTSTSAILNPMLDEFIDDVLAQTGDDQVYLVGHSLGVALSINYLNSSPERTARVAKFIGVDSASAGQQPVCPGTPDPLPCMGIYQTANQNLFLGDNNVYLPDGHVALASSAESFAHQYEFFTGQEPKTTLVLPEPPGLVEVAGRLIDFPANTGLDAAVEIWQVDAQTGARVELRASLQLDETGDWGPVRLNGNHPHEFQVSHPRTRLTGHIYTQPFIRSDYMVRLLSTPPGSPALTFTNTDANHTVAVILRNREWWSNHPSAQNDVLEITTTSPSRGTEAAGNILSPATGNTSVGIHVHDAAATPGVSTLNLLPVFPLFPFQTGVDVFMPATDPPDGVISFQNAPRGDTSIPQVLNIPNWASDQHRLGVYFNDYAQGINTWGECKRARLC